ncbi:LSU ribosomal protein L10P [Thermosyntropha lipolytica DSM 11003]|uniref:Large ribosomal subunit protein uL10 n=1 Tax=Thermosyntropha lipolytica DSM 11003 TaxID=1123382 RepID=A0A1M5QV01_9FIRM|nr:50S ribosomal protein L10 [Thermosyntropha lipolytica]SHH17373.1 LSU ribosomal protein L10P [Thermosyntropha lipolytica DSM 11003]
MPKIEEKQKIVKAIEEDIKESTLVVFTDFRGLTVEEMTNLRVKLRIPGVKYKVLKNTMIRFALRNLGHEDIAEQIEGPNAVLFSKDDPVTPAKVLFDFIKETKKLEVKGGILEGKLVTADKVKALADLPPREVLVAQVLGTMQAPIQGLVTVLNANIAGLVRALDQIREQKAAS